MPTDTTTDRLVLPVNNGQVVVITFGIVPGGDDRILEDGVTQRVLEDGTTLRITEMEG